MSKRMLIDAARPEETRVVVADGAQLEDYDVALASRPQIKGNIYLAKVVRVEASLQAAFVDYGHEKHGFLSFTEIHPDYFQIPVADREAIVARDSELARQEAEADELDDDGNDDIDAREPTDELAADAVDEDEEQAADGGSRGGRPRRRVSRRRSEKQRRAELYRNYRIQEVIRNGQLILVQATKEQRGTKGAVFSSYISLPGRYTVLMPNTPHSGGVSRKIGSPEDRKRLRKVVKDLEVAEGMSVILRTVAKGRTRAEIRRDFDYVVSLWSDIREKTLNSVGASLVHKENDLVKRAVRDMYQSDVDEVIVAGEGAYRRAKEITKTLSPSKARHVKLYRGDLPFYHSYAIERPLANVHRPEVRLPSGGSMVIAQTEALVTVDINSGRAIRERHIEETALKTNLEAVDELARQFRLRDLAGLIVIDFIGMERRRNNEQVEQRLKEALKHDRARTHVGRMSEFGLIEMSRQRLRASIHDTQHEACANCHGHGWIYRPEAHALMVIRALECEVANYRGCRFRVSVPHACAQHLSETMWRSVHQLETQFEVRIEILATTEPLVDNYLLEVVRADGTTVSLTPSQAGESEAGTARQGERNRRGARSRGAAREDEGADERPARARRARSTDADNGADEGDEDRRSRNRNGRVSARRSDDDDRRRSRNGRRRPAARADFDDDAGEEVMERRRPMVDDEYDEEGDEERRPRTRRTRASARNGYDDTEERRRPRNRRGRTLEREELDDAPDDDRSRYEGRARAVDDGDYDAEEERRRSSQRSQYAERDGGDDDNFDEGVRSRRRPRAQSRHDIEDDAADRPRSRGRRARGPARPDYDDEFPEEPRSRRRRAQPSASRETMNGLDDEPRTGQRRAESELSAYDDEVAADESRRRSRRSRSIARDGQRSDSTDDSRPRRARSPRDTLEDRPDAADSLDSALRDGGEGALGDRPEAPETPADLADAGDYPDGAADSPFGAPSETSPPSRGDRSGRRTRRGSRGGSRRRGSRAQRGDAQAPELHEQLAPETGDASTGPADLSESEQSADLAVAARDPDPFGAAIEGSRLGAGAQVSTFATAPNHPFEGADEPILQDAQVVEAGGVPELAPANDDPFGAAAQVTLDTDPVGDDDGAATSPENPFAGEEPAPEVRQTLPADSELNGKSQALSEDEAMPKGARWWNPLRNRS
ncbi:MAG: Rne/Rng family ribonuclease [Alphaproteobacteria bacterium]|nr:Rne/Rng family ribonuclease [Alphaproteobacteria bacterium]